MKTNHFLEKLTSDLPAKIFSFIIALFLCLFYQLSLVDTRSFSVPLRVVQDGEVVRVSDVPSSVKVTVRSNRSYANLINAEKFHATLNISSITESGAHDVDVFLDIDKELLEIDPLEVKTKPEKVQVTVERKIRKAVRLETPVTGSVLYGYSVSDIQTSPDKIYISGPESVVNGTKSVLTDTVDVTDLETDTKFNVNIQKINKFISYSTADNYEVFVGLTALEMEKEFADVKILLQNLSSEFALENDLPLFSVKIAGALVELEDYQVGNLNVSVDFGEITEEGEYTLPVKVSLPVSISVLEQSFDTVTVKVIKKPQEQNVLSNNYL